VEGRTVKNVKKIVDKVATLVAQNKKITLAAASLLVLVGVVSSENSETVANIMSAFATILSVVL